MTPRSFVLAVVALFGLFWFALVLNNSNAVAQPDDPGAGSAVGAAQPQQEQPVLTIQTEATIIRNIPAHFTATVTIEQETYIYTWAFGDGSTAQGRVTTHTFQNAGVFRVTVSATRNGQRLEASKDVTVLPTPPVPPIEGLTCTQNGPVEANDPVRIEASVTKGEPVTYSWAVGQPGIPLLDGAVVTHRYPAPGSYRATVTARNPATPQGVTCSVDITVLDETIAGLDFAWTGTPQVDSSLQFEAKKERGTRVIYEWFFGDGFNAVGERSVHTFKQLGFYEITLVASNSRNVLRRTRTLLVVPLTPHLVGSSNDGPKPVGALLTAFASMAGDDPTTSFTWRWGDGSPADTTRGPSATHRYTSAGAYGIQVIARNDGGAMAHTNIAYIGDNSPLQTLLITHSFSSDLMIPVSRPVTLTAIFDPPLPDANYEDYEYIWNWGDGTFSHGRAPRAGHTYLSSNNFVVQVTATLQTTVTTPLRLYGATVVLVAPNIYFPLLAQNSSFMAASPADGFNPPTPTSTPTPEAMETSEPVETEEPEPDETQQPEPGATEEPVDGTPSPFPSAVVETPSPTATPTVFSPTPNPPTATATPTATETPTFTPTFTEEAEPTPTLTPTQTREEGGTIPPLSS